MKRTSNNFFWVSVFVVSFVCVCMVTIVPWYGAKAGISMQEQTFFTDKYGLIENKKSEIERMLDNAYNENLFNGQVLYAENGNILLKKTYGFADLYRKTPMDSSWRFQLSSTSKPLTAAAIMKLYDEGEIDIDKSVKEYLPDFPFPGNITVKHLLQHRSGLPNYIYIADKNWNKKTPFTNRNLSPFLKRMGAKVKFPAGLKFEYCNTNYAYLALLIEKCSGFTFEYYLKTKIFEPLGMTRTYVYNPTKKRLNETVKGYSFSQRRGYYERYVEFLDGVVGDKGIYSTVDDLYKFDQALFDSNFLSPKSISLMFTPAEPLSEDHDNDYGLGFRIRKDIASGDVSVFHHGWWNGFRSYYVHSPNNERVLIWLNNRSDVTLASLIKAIFTFTDSLDHPEKYRIVESDDEYYGGSLE
ncbi:MAG: beta-lactamase family protein [Bacteroidales bacterium]|nr:beta-lactamase family protein [Bacteroidales bacterium]